MNTRSGPRVDWVDYAKGICIFFVVMLHVNTLAQDHLDRTGWLEAVVQFARPFRMPDFFLLAGLFLANTIDKPLRTFVDRKVVHFAYFYLLWMTLQFVAFEGRHEAAAGGWGWNVASLFALRLVEPPGALWFIYILPIFFMTVRLTRRVPAWAMLAAGIALHSAQVHTGWTIPDEFAARFVYFFAGYAFAPLVFRIAERAREQMPGSVAYLAAWAPVNGALVLAGWSKLPGVSLLLGFAGALAVVVVAVLLARVTWSAPLRYIGQHSIVIYLSDYVISVVLLRVFLPFIPDVGTLASVLTLSTIVVAVVAWRIALRTPARFLYERPAALWLVPARS